jgi:hypothetical protein
MRNADAVRCRETIGQEHPKTAAQLAEEREQAERTERSDRERIAVEARERELLRFETIDFLDSLSRRQLASIDPVDLEEMLELIDDSD